MGPKIPREDLIDDLNSANERVSGVLTKVEYKSIGEYSPETVAREFDSWNKAKDIVGIKKSTQGDRTTIRSMGYRLRRMRQVKESVGCYFCGYDDDGVALDFHHTSKDSKNNSVSWELRSGWYDWLEEAEKCIVVCSNCHRRLEHGQITYKQ